MAKRKNKSIIGIFLLIILAVVLALSMTWSRDIELSLGLCYYVDSDGNRVDVSVVKSQSNTQVKLQASGSSANGTLTVNFVDVGQGDCCIIEMPSGDFIIIDGGENKSSVRSSIDTFIENNLPDDFKYFDYCILTHPDSDHCGSLNYVLNNYPARVSYRPNVEAVGTASNPYEDPCTSLTADAVEKDTAVYAKTIKAMYEPTAEHDFTPTVVVTDPSDDSQTIKVGMGDNECTLTFFTPLSTKYTGTGQWNNYSPVMVLEYQGYLFVMTGDAEEKNLGEFVSKVEAAKTDGVTDKYDIFDEDFCANVIKAGHHGSRNATTSEFLEIVTAPNAVENSYSVISCGEGNSYGHPHSEAVERIKNVGIKDENILRTDEAGDITFTVRMDEDGSYKLFYGDVVADDTPNGTPDVDDTDTPGDIPDLDDTDTPDDTPDGDTDGNDKTETYTLVYRTIGGIKLTWAVVAWSVYAVVAIVVLAIIFIGGSSNDEGKDKGKSSRGSSNGRRRTNGSGRKKSTNKRGGRR